MEPTGTDAAGVTDPTAGPSAGVMARDSLAGRMFIDSGGAFSFFDSVFAVAMTLLVTTLAPSADSWRSWSTLWDDSGTNLMAFAISFLLIAVYWWGNRKFLSSLQGISPRIVFCNLLMLAFVVLLPVTTSALGEASGSGAEIATIVYAIDIAVISSILVVEFLVARAEGLLDPVPSPRVVRAEVLDGLLVPVVFLASIPVTLLVSASAGRWTWALLIVLGPISGRRRARERATAA